MDYKRVISSIFLIIWIIVIFMFSNEPATLSHSKSDKVAKTTIDTVSTVTGNDYTKSKITIDSRYVVRKVAHFTLYFILGVLSITVLRNYGISNRIVLYSILFCLIYAISDEIHQLFIAGRNFKLLDIFIDTSGGIVGSLTIYYTKIRGRN